MSFLGKNQKRVNSRIFTSSPYIWSPSFYWKWPFQKWLFWWKIAKIIYPSSPTNRNGDCPKKSWIPYVGTNRENPGIHSGYHFCDFLGIQPIYNLVTYSLPWFWGAFGTFLVVLNALKRGFMMKCEKTAFCPGSCPTRRYLPSDCLFSRFLASEFRTKCLLLIITWRVPIRFLNEGHEFTFI